MTRRFAVLDERVRSWLQRWSIPALRVSVAIVFIWFGALKVLDVTPVTDLVADTVYWFDPDWVVPLLGWVELLLGLGLLFKIALRVVLAAFLMMLLGTFLVFVVQPDVAFRDGNPLLLTVEGEFVVKNVVLLSAGAVIGASVRPPRPLEGSL